MKPRTASCRIGGVEMDLTPKRIAAIEADFFQRMKQRKAIFRIGGIIMNVPLERGIKIPPIDYTARSGLRIVWAKSRLRNIWPWKHMRNHESLLIPWGFASSVEMMRSACEHSRYHPGMKFIFRSCNEGMRVWRKDSVSHPKNLLTGPRAHGKHDPARRR